MKKQFETFNDPELAKEEALAMEKKIESGKAKDYDEAEQELRIEKALKHWERGHLGVTADDHKAIGGTPDLELRKNPNKTLGELWSEKQILEYLRKRSIFLEKARQEYKEKGDLHYWSKDDIISSKKSLRLAISYLKLIRKLPKEFDNFEIKDLESDPKEQ